MDFPNWVQVKENTKITFSHRDATKIKSKQFSEFCSQTVMVHFRSPIDQLKPGSYTVVTVVIIGNRKQVQAYSERDFSQLLQSVCSLYA